MQISDSQLLSISEKMRLAAEAEYRKSEKALTQASGAEMGLPQDEESQQQKSMLALQAEHDNVSLSPAAMLRTRAAAGDKTGEKSGDDAGKKDAGMRAPVMASAGSGAGGEADPLQEVRKKIRDVEKKLKEAQAKLAEAAGMLHEAEGKETASSEGGDAQAVEKPAAAGPADTTENADGRQVESEEAGAEQAAPESSGTERVGKNEGSAEALPLHAPKGAGGGKTAQAEAEMAAAEAEVNALSGQLMTLYKELMDALKSQGE